jgi:hypothetical protein
MTLNPFISSAAFSNHTRMSRGEHRPDLDLPDVRDRNGSHDQARDGGAGSPLVIIP